MSWGQVRRLPPVDFGLTGGMAISQGNPSLRSAAFFLEGYTDLPVAGPFSLLLTAGGIFTEKKSDADFNIILYDAGFALKMNLPVRWGIATPFAAVGPSIFYFDPIGSVDSEDALRTLGLHVHLGLTYPVSDYLNIRPICRIGITSTDAEQFPLSLPRGPNAPSVHTYIGLGIFFRI